MFLMTRAVMLLVLLLVMDHASAALRLSASRLIVSAAEDEASLNLNNSEEFPVVVQTWLDAGDASALPSAVFSPFALNLPLFRIEGGKSRALRLKTAQPEVLAKDRESLYWLNILEIPATQQIEGNDDGGQFQVNTRSRLKVFYRPMGLQGEPGAAARAVRWSVVDAVPGHARVLRVRNDSPWYVSLVGIEIAGAEIPLADGAVKPLSTLEVPLPSVTQTTALTYFWVDDEGQVQTSTAVLLQN